MVRPVGVTILAVLSFLGAVVLVMAGLASFFLGGLGVATMGQEPGAGMMLAGLGAFAGVFLLILGAFYAIVGYGLWKLLSWGRILALILVALIFLTAVLGLISALVQFNVATILWQLCVCAVGVWILWYLTRPHVKQAFAPPIASAGPSS